MANILIIDDHPLFRESLKGILEKNTLHNEAFEIIQADNASDALALISQQKSLKYIFTDIEMPGMDGIALLQVLRKQLPETNIVMISGSESPEDVQKALKLGAKGFIQKNSETSILLAALQLIFAGGTYIPPLMLEAQSIPTPASQAPMNLTERQLEILSFLQQGLQNKIIAHQLDLSEATVKVHVRHIFSVLGVKNRTQAVQKAQEIGIL